MVAEELRAELDRLETSDSEIPSFYQFPFVVGIEIIPSENAEARDVLSRAVQVQRKVNRVILKRGWISADEWRGCLPPWFIEACDNPLGNATHGDSQVAPWPVVSWIEFRHPEDRGWYWWKGEVVESQKALIEVGVEDLPFPAGDLEWLLIASGAREIESTTPGALA